MAKRPRSPLPDAEPLEEPPDARCGCVRINRVGWTDRDLLTWPIGVHAVEGGRFHATWGDRSGPPLHLGCFASAGEAAGAWDAEARRRGWSLVNRPQAAGEQCVLYHCGVTSPDKSQVVSNQPILTANQWLSGLWDQPARLQTAHRHLTGDLDL